MSEDPDEGETADEPRQGDRTARPDEPLGDLAARVREGTGEREPAEHPDPPSREGPLADVASEVDERRRKREERDVFESVDVGELDGEKLWEQLAEGRTTEAEAGPSVPMDEPPEVEPDDDGRDVRTIPKETCHGCPHFGDPPELACTHDGTVILAMPDSDHFRVADCPMVVGEEEITTFQTEGDGGSDPEEASEPDSGEFDSGESGEKAVGGDERDATLGDGPDDSNGDWDFGDGDPENPGEAENPDDVEGPDDPTE